MHYSITLLDANNNQINQFEIEYHAGATAESMLPVIRNILVSYESRKTHKVIVKSLYRWPTNSILTLAEEDRDVEFYYFCNTTYHK